MQKFLTPIAVLIAGGAIAGALLWSNSGSTGAKPASAGIPVNVKQVNMKDEPTIGQADAPIEVAYWSDYQCPFCKQFDTTILPQIIQNYVDTGKIRIVFKDFQFIGADSDADALYARAVWHLYPEKFNEWHAAMYAGQAPENSLSAAENVAHVRGITNAIPGMSFDDVTTDVAANKATYSARIAADRAEGSALGINATPSFVIGRQLISGAKSYADMASAIDTALISR